MAYELREYQLDMVQRARGLIRAGRRRILFQAPTGSGKTVQATSIFESSSKRGNRCCFVVHRRELVRQASIAFDMADIHHGIISAQYPNRRDDKAPVQIASIQTLARRLDTIEPFDLMGWDECHHMAAKSWAKVYDRYSGAVHLGFSATPQRLDGAGLDPFFDDLLPGPSVSQLIDEGWLSPYRLFAPGGGLDTSGLHTRMGDYITGELEQLVDKPTITGDAVEHYQLHADGERAVVFCCSIKHSQHVCAAFNEAGIPAEHIDGNMPSEDRDAALQRFARGDTLVLTNVDIVGEGFDLPSLTAVLMLRPTKSLGRYLQACGRALRPAPGKTEAIILDHAGNCMQQGFGFPCDDREWLLEGSKGKNQKDTGSPVRVCPKCFAALPAAARSCPYCAHKFKPVPRQIRQVHGTLEELDKTKMRQRAADAQRKARTYEDLVALGRRRGYSSPERWAWHVFNGRQKYRQQQVALWGALSDV